MRVRNPLVFPLLAVLLLVAVTATPAFAQKAPLCPIDANGRVAEVFYQKSSIAWEPIVQHHRMRLSVLTPCGTITKVFERGETPFFDLGEVPGQLDGQYSWELRIDPEVDPGVRKALDTARSKGDFSTPLELQSKGLLPSGPLVDSATFSVFRGEIVDPGSGQEEGSSGKSTVAGNGLSPSRAGNGSVAFASDGLATEGAPLTRAVAPDFVINDDLIVDGSACIGFDCVNGEVFSFDTIRLKENNLRIKFDDTSTVPSFPANDWELVANDSANGGASKFTIKDASANRNIFTVEANAPSNSLYVDDGGRAGFGTATPSVELHVIDGDTPTLRLQQDGSSGFEPQTWDVAGNETNFFVRDVTNGSALPFRIRPGAPSNSLFVDVDSDVGMGTSSPATALHVRRTATGSAQIRVEDTAGDAILSMMELKNAGEVRFAVEDTSAANRRWEMRTTGDNFQFTRSNAPAADMLITQAGNMTIRGTLTTGGPTCGGGCDAVFAADYALPSIEEHAAEMWTNGFLPAIGPTVPKAPFNLVEKTGGILNELEKAHIYIEQLHQRNSALEGQQETLQGEYRSLEQEQQAMRNEQQDLRDELARLRAEVARLVGQSP